MAITRVLLYKPAQAMCGRVAASVSVTVCVVGRHEPPGGRAGVVGAVRQRGHRVAARGHQLALRARAQPRRAPARAPARGQHAAPVLPGHRRRGVLDQVRPHASPHAYPPSNTRHTHLMTA